MYKILTFEEIEALKLKKGMTVEFFVNPSLSYIGMIKCVKSKKGKSRKQWNGRYDAQYDIKWHEISFEVDGRGVLEEKFHKIEIIQGV